MSEMDMDKLPRMKDYLKPEDLDTGACIDLASEVLKGLANDLIMAARQYVASPTEENKRHLDALKAMYRSDWFKAMSAGVADGETVMKQLIHDALGGRMATKERRNINL